MKKRLARVWHEHACLCAPGDPSEKKKTQSFLLHPNSVPSVLSVVNMQK